MLKDSKGTELCIGDYVSFGTATVAVVVKLKFPQVKVQRVSNNGVLYAHGTAIEYLYPDILTKIEPEDLI